MAQFLLAPTPNDEAVAFIADKPAVSRAVFDQLLPELKARAFTITGIQAADVLQRSRDLIATLPAGGDWDEIKHGLIQEISPYFVDSSASQEDQAKQQQAAENRAELLIRTHGQQAYAASQYATLNEQRDLFPNWQYLTLGDNHVRRTHAALDGVVLPANHEFWNTHFPPWEWGCRCQCVPLTRADTAEIVHADRDKPADHQRVLGDYAQADLTTNRRLVRNGVTYNMTAPREEGKPGAFAFHPADLRIDPATLKARYSPEVFDTFEQWARGQSLGEGKSTVWDWMGGAAADATAPAGGWPDPAKLQFVQRLGGSTGAELVRDPATGRQYVRKRGSSPEHLREEALADQLYAALGVPTPPSQLIETATGPVKLSEFIEGQTLGKVLEKASPAKRKAMYAEASKHFAADALLGNWDVAGMGLDNLLVDAKGKIFRIDNGGALRFRAQGAPKGEAWNPFPTELWTMRDPAKNGDSAKLFGGLDIFGIARQIEGLDGGALEHAPEDLRPVLEARLGHLRDVATKALDMQHDAWKAGYTDDLTRHIVGLRAHGVFDTLSRELTQKAGEVQVVDENGLAWDHLRSHKNAAAAASSDPFHQPLLAAVKSLNSHGAKGDFAFNQGTISTALAQKPALEKLAKSKSAIDQAKAAHYLTTLGEIEKAVEAAGQKKYQQIPTFNAFTAPAAKAAKQPRSVVEAFAEYCQASGLSNAPASDWMSAQAGSSWNADARAYKWFVAQHLDVPPGELYWSKVGEAKCAADWKTFSTKHGAKAEQSLIARHALVQEVLGKVQFRFNDQTRRAVRLSRTEQASVMKASKLTPGATLRMPRGANESSSVFRKVQVHGSEVTIQAVPHSRITGMYLLERDAGLANCSFLGDGENEFTFIAPGLPFDYVSSVSFAGSSDATKWHLDLSHLRTTTPTP